MICKLELEIGQEAIHSCNDADCPYHEDCLGKIYYCSKCGGELMPSQMFWREFGCSKCYRWYSFAEINRESEISIYTEEEIISRLGVD